MLLANLCAHVIYDHKLVGNRREEIIDRSSSPPTINQLLLNQIIYSVSLTLRPNRLACVIGSCIYHQISNIDDNEHTTQRHRILPFKGISNLKFLELN